MNSITHMVSILILFLGLMITGMSITWVVTLSIVSLDDIILLIIISIIGVIFIYAGINMYDGSVQRIKSDSINEELISLTLAAATIKLSTDIRNILIFTLSIVAVLAGFGIDFLITYVDDPQMFYLTGGIAFVILSLITLIFTMRLRVRYYDITSVAIPLIDKFNEIDNELNEFLHNRSDNNNEKPE